jgi:3-phosphoshikimate 1-carboxyvinyltransferase
VPAAAITLEPLHAARGTIALPGSKSISNRTLLLAALAQGRTTLSGLLAADDTQRMTDALTALGVPLHDAIGGDLEVSGTGGRLPADHADLFLGNAGTAFRPLTAVLALQGGDYTLHGVPRMHERPIGDLVNALRTCGCAIDYLERAGFPPLRIGAAGGRAGGRVAVRGDVSSQFLSALLLALPLARGADAVDTMVDVTTPLVSRPYVDITTRLMSRFGVDVAAPDARTFVVPAGARYRSPGRVMVEGDASSASYFLAAGVLGGGPVRVTGAGAQSIQGDVAFARVLAAQGAQVTLGETWMEAARGTPLRGGTLDCTEIPDAAMTLALVALFAAAPTRLTGIGSWRVKETDRIAAMAAELRKFGARVEEGPDSLRIEPPPGFLDPTAPRGAPVAVDTYDDHRMAMCVSLASFGPRPVRINDPGCVAKTFPAYFDVFGALVK